MKLSLMLLNLTFSIFMDEHFRPKETADITAYEKILKIARDAGYHAVDLSNLEFELFGDEKVKELLDKYQLECASIILFEDYTCCEKNGIERVQKHTQNLIDTASKINCPNIMLVAAGAHPDQNRSSLQNGLVQNLSAAVKYAKDKGVTVCIEDFPSLKIPMCSMKDISYLLDQVEGLKLVYDSANMIIENESPEQYFLTFKDKIAYYHLKDVRIADEHESLGDVMYDGKKMIATQHGKGIIDFSGLLRWIKESGYQGYMSVEYAFDKLYSTDAENDILNARILLESYITEANYTRGL